MEQEEKKLPEGLEEAAKEYATKWHKRPDGSEWKSIFPKAAIRDFIAGAEWQKAKMLKDNPVILPVEDFQALIDSHAKRVEADYKEKMMKDAVKIEVKEDAGGFPIVPLDAIELYDYENDKPLAKAGDKVKVIVIKED